MTRGKPFKHHDPWNDYERLLVIVTPRSYHGELSKFLQRTRASVRMKKDALMWIYAEMNGIGVAGLDTHGKEDVEFMNRWGEMACDEFKVTAMRRALNNLRKGVL